MNINNRTFKIFIFFIEKLMKERCQEKIVSEMIQKLGVSGPVGVFVTNETGVKCYGTNGGLAILRNERIITIKFCPSFLILYLIV